MGSSEAAAADDLDVLIGDIRREAARRRAAPDFPVEDEARLSAEMDAQGPAGVGGADLAAITAALRAIEKSAEEVPSGVGGPAEVGRPAGLADLAGLAASAITALSVRLAELERRSARPNVRAERLPRSDRAVQLTATWLDAVLAAARGGTGRVLVGGAGAQEWVDPLCGAGIDAYGVDPAEGAFADRGVVRSGSVLEHLRTVGAGALALTVLVGPLPVEEVVRLEELAAELARTSGRVAVCGESPWSWRRRVGDGSADTSRSRPVGPEAWLEALTAAGMEATAGYDSIGLSYLLTAEPAGRLAG